MNYLDRYTTAVYQFFDGTGELLYVGITHNPRQRFISHSGGNEWFTDADVTRTVVEWFPDRAAAAAEERRLIHEQRPAYNKDSAQRNGNRTVQPSLPLWWPDRFYGRVAQSPQRDWATLRQHGRWPQW